MIHWENYQNLKTNHTVAINAINFSLKKTKATKKNIMTGRITQNTINFKHLYKYLPLNFESILTLIDSMISNIFTKVIQSFQKV